MSVMNAVAQHRLALLLPAVAGLLLTAAPPAAAESCFCGSQSLTVSAGEVRDGDIYFWGGNVDVAGTLDGDLIGLAQSAVISGDVMGDVAIIGASLDIQGTVHDTARFWGNSVTVSGTVDGDMLGFGNAINIHPRGHVTGGVYVLAGSTLVEGTIDGGLKFTGGKLMVSGTIKGDVEVEADTIRFEPGARIEGDFAYESRRPLEADLESIVGGEVLFTERTDDDDEPEPFVTLSDVLWWSWFTVGAMLVGLVAVAILRPRAVAALTRPLDDEPVLGALIGLGAFFVTPAAALLAIVLLVTIPLGVLTLLLFLVALYLAKLPVALWLGQRLLRPVRGGGVSPYLALIVGVLALQLVFEVPYLGRLAWLVSVFLGLGAMILAIRSRVGQAEGGPA